MWAFYSGCGLLSILDSLSALSWICLSQMYLQEYSGRSSLLAKIQFVILTFATKIRISQSTVFLLWREMLAFIFGTTLICPLCLFINEVNSTGFEETQRVSCDMYYPLALVHISSYCQSPVTPKEIIRICSIMENQYSFYEKSETLSLGSSYICW